MRGRTSNNLAATFYANQLLQTFVNKLCDPLAYEYLAFKSGSVSLNTLSEIKLCKKMAWIKSEINVIYLVHGFHVIKCLSGEASPGRGIYFFIRFRSASLKEVGPIVKLIIRAAQLQNQSIGKAISHVTLKAYLIGRCDVGVELPFYSDIFIIFNQILPS